LSSIGASPTVDPLNPRPKKTKDDLMSEACLLEKQWLLLDSQSSKEILDASRNSEDVCKEQLRVVSNLAIDNDPPNPLLRFKRECTREESIYEEEKQRADIEINEIQGTIKTGQDDLKEAETRLRGESQAKKMQVDVEYDEKKAKYDAEIAKLQSLLQSLPKEREAAKKRVDAECGTEIAKLQRSHEEEEQRLNRKLQSYQGAKQKLQEQKVTNLAYPMALVLAIELTHKILKEHLKYYEKPNPTLMNDIVRMEDKLQSLQNAIAQHEIGTCYKIVWNYHDVDDTD
jgi:hypothetical protein